MTVAAGPAAGEPGRLPGRAALLLFAGLFLCLPLTPPHVLGAQARVLLLDGVGLVALLLLLAAGWRRGALELPATPSICGFVLLLIAAGLSVAGATEPSVALIALPFLLALTAVHIGMQVLVTSVDSARRIALLATGAAVVVALFGLISYLRFRDDLAAGLASESDRPSYLATPFFEHSYLTAQALLPVLILAIGSLLFGGPRLLRVVVLVLLIPVAAFLATILSRAAHLATLAGLGVLLFGGLLHLTRTRHGDRAAATLKLVLRGLLVFAAGVGVLAWMGVLGTSLEGTAHRFASLTRIEYATFNFSRLLVWEDSLRLAAEHLPFGVGQGNFGIEFGNVHLNRRSVPHAHNQFLQTLAETGPLGLMGLLLALLHPLVLAGRALPRALARPDLVGAILGVSAALTVLVVYALFESPLLFASSAFLIAALGGLLVRLSVLARQGEVAVTRTVHGPPLRLLCVAAALAVLLIILTAGPRLARTALARYDLYQATAQLAAGDLELATWNATQATRRAPYLPEAWRLLAEVQRSRGELEEALESFRRHERLAPGMPQVLWFQATLALQLGRPADAIAPLQQATWSAPADSRHALTLSWAHACYDAGRFEEARLLYSTLLRENYHGENLVVLRRLAETLLNLSRERGLVENLLERFIARAEGDETQYARQLLDSIDDYYTNPWDAASR